MDSSSITSALETARGLVAAHGLMGHMTNWSKGSIARPLDSKETQLRLEFCLDPSKASWEAGNTTCSLVIDYNGGPNYEVNGDTYRDYSAAHRLSYSSGEFTLGQAMLRENMTSALIMLLEMIATLVPQKITVVIATAQEKVEAAKKAEIAQIGKALGRYLVPSDTKGLRTGGKGRTVPMPQGYTEKYGEIVNGNYPYKQVRRWNRRGDATEVVNYNLAIFTNLSGTHILITRV